MTKWDADGHFAPRVIVFTSQIATIGALFPPLRVDPSPGTFSVTSSPIQPIQQLDLACTKLIVVVEASWSSFWQFSLCSSMWPVRSPTWWNFRGKVYHRRTIVVLRFVLSLLAACYCYCYYSRLSICSHDRLISIWHFHHRAFIHLL